MEEKYDDEPIKWADLDRADQELKEASKQFFRDLGLSKSPEHVRVVKASAAIYSTKMLAWKDACVAWERARTVHKKVDFIGKITAAIAILTAVIAVSTFVLAAVSVLDFIY